MKKLIVFLLVLCHTGMIYAQESQFTFASYNSSGPKKSYFRLGEKLIVFAKHGQATEEGYVLISFHNNERSASQTAKQFVSSYGGLFIELLNDNQKNISFSLYDKQVVFDPEKIFTPNGRWAPLRSSKKNDQIVNSKINEFAKFMIGEIPYDKAIISVHSNPEGGIDVNSYKRKGIFSRDTRTAFINPDMDPDDYFLTTSKTIFDKLKARNFNVVLQAYTARDDGSLSVFCAKSKRIYISVETEENHKTEQVRMLQAIADILQ